MDLFSQNILHIAGVILVLSIGVLTIFVISYMEKSRRLKSSLVKLNKSFTELDEQAKLIVKTDLELHKAQAELDKRFSGLDALQKTSRMVSTTLDETEIYNRLRRPLLTDLGFEKILVMTGSANEEFSPQVTWKFNEQDIEKILLFIKSHPQIVSALQENQILSSDKRITDIKAQDILEDLGIKHYVIAPILSQNNMLGVILAADSSDSFVMTEGDKELISILADQVGQAIRNARLFEEVYRSRQGLEAKVSERTKQLTQALDDVKKISEMKSEFISAVSHELRTPLTSIKGYASILMAGKVGEIPTSVKERLEKINKHSDNLVKLINDLLDISRIESGRVEMKYTKQDIHVIIENIKDLLTPQMREKNIQFAAEIPPGLPQVSIDANQIERVFINLVSNAIKFTPEKGQITITADKEKDEIKFTVSDTGIGIKKEDQEKLFAEFYRADNEINQVVKGTGLGLSLVKKIIEAHGGKVWLTSKMNEGSHFFFTLPIN